MHDMWSDAHNLVKEMVITTNIKHELLCNHKSTTKQNCLSLNPNKMGLATWTNTNQRQFINYIVTESNYDKL